MTDSLVYATGLKKEYIVGASPVLVLKSIDISVKMGEFVAIMGASGSGKSTLMHILGCLDRPTAGKYMFNGIDVLTTSDNALSQVRAKNIGFVFQTFNLLADLNVYENVELPFHYSELGSQQIKARVMRSVEEVNLQHRVKHKPSELSGGEKQRVAIARALAIEPKLILADEPTGNLDSENSAEILKLFKLIHAQGSTIIIVTHDREVAVQAQTIKQMKDGIFV
ncbi:ABC transporter ATP-binding protein [Desulfococcaceae bacterium HSG7]|nr:ABC transporter ATP-binding protein [Desulfococcaceae bacterium HSG7]